MTARMRREEENSMNPEKHDTKKHIFDFKDYHTGKTYSI